jgi:putative peptidoglycan lipid II flippase
LLNTTIRVLIAAACLAGVSYLTWYGLDQALGRSIGAQVLSMSAALSAGAVVYFLAARLLRIAEVEQLLNLLPRRGG